MSNVNNTRIEEVRFQVAETYSQSFNKKVLLAEDDTVGRELIEIVLEKRGILVDCVEDGLQAVEQYKKDRYSLILMDISMPNLDGLSATLLIRKAEKNKGNRIPIIAITANALKGDKERCLAAGMDDYISKPLNLGELNRILDKWLNSTCENQ